MFVCLFRKKEEERNSANNEDKDISCVKLKILDIVAVALIVRIQFKIKFFLQRIGGMLCRSRDLIRNVQGSGTRRLHVEREAVS